MNCLLPQSKLYARTLELLKQRPRTLTIQKIAEDTNLPLGWLYSIICHPDLQPAVNRVECLYEYLSGQKILL